MYVFQTVLLSAGGWAGQVTDRCRLTGEGLCEAAGSVPAGSSRTAWTPNTTVTATPTALNGAVYSLVSAVGM